MYLSLPRFLPLNASLYCVWNSCSRMGIWRCAGAQLHSDESPMSSLDSGMGDRVESDSHYTSTNSGAQDRHGGAYWGSTADGTSNYGRPDTMNVDDSTNRKVDKGDNGSGSSNVRREMNTEERQTAMVAMYGAQGMHLAMPPDGGVPLLQVCTHTLSRWKLFMDHLVQGPRKDPDHGTFSGIIPRLVCVKAGPSRIALLSESIWLLAPIDLSAQRRHDI